MVWVDPEDNYRKKPVVIKAWKLTPERFLDMKLAMKTGSNIPKPLSDKFPIWIQKAWDLKRKHLSGRRMYLTMIKEKWVLCIETLEGDHFAQIGDWIIKGIKGELYPCKPDIFEQTYEKVRRIDEIIHRRK